MNKVRSANGISTQHHGVALCNEGDRELNIRELKTIDIDSHYPEQTMHIEAIYIEISLKRYQHVWHERWIHSGWL